MRREYEIVAENPPVNVESSSNPLLIASNTELNKKRLIKVGDVNGTARSHLFIPDNIFGLSNTILNSQAPELNCKTGGTLSIAYLLRATTVLQVKFIRVLKKPLKVLLEAQMAFLR